jgi:hypothetical protein
LSTPNEYTFVQFLPEKMMRIYNIHWMGIM